MIDGIEIVKGFGRKMIDPMATKKQIAPLLDGKAREMKLRIAELKEKAKNDDGKDPSLKDAIKKALLSIDAESKEFHRKAFEENKVFFELTGGDKDVEADELEELSRKFKQLKEREKLTVDGDVVKDIRGTEYWIIEDSKWARKTVKVLGDLIPKTGKVAAELSKDEQAEISKQFLDEKIAGMAEDEKAELITREKEFALGAAAAYKSKLEIKGDADALSKAQKQFEDAVAAIEKKYS